jgi:hypothetical protein
MAMTLSAERVSLAADARKVPQRITEALFMAYASRSNFADLVFDGLTTAVPDIMRIVWMQITDTRRQAIGA